MRKMMFTRKNILRTQIALISAGLASVASPLASAQSAAMLEEVVVTARKRDESLQDAPISVRAFSASEIQSAGINTPEDFIALTPNVTLVQTQNAGNSFITMRGITQNRNSEMSAAVLVDGVLMSNPAMFNQQLFDIEQIEVLRGPQGALYGRNAIGGAITIVSKAPSEEFEGSAQVTAVDDPGYRVKGVVSGPITDTLRYRVSGSYTDYDGNIDNEFLDTEANPVKDFSGRLRLLWEASDTVTADLRVSYSDLDTKALYYRIGDEADNTSLDVRTNNRGKNEREFINVALKLDWETDYGTLISVTAYDDLDELLTGDQFDFLPRDESFFNSDPFGGFIKFLTGDPVTDLSQNQYLEVTSWSQELRFVSPAENRLRWIVGGYVIQTDRYISTGSQIDRGFGVFDVKKNFRPSVFIDPTDPSPQLGILADDQDNLAWAVFGEIAYDLNDQWEASFSLRYDKDDRENTTKTPPIYDVTGLGLVFGEERNENWDDLQPKVTLRYKPNEDWMLYGGYSRGFRSGGFNQTGVGEAVPNPGVQDIFDDQTADTFELGAKATLWDGRMSASLSTYYTDFDGAYFFFYDPVTNTQNLGNIDNTEYYGLEFEANASLTESLSAYIGIGWTDSEIKDSATPSDEGNNAPFVSDYTLNLGGVFRTPTGFAESDFVARVDWQRIGETWWDPANISSRDDIDLVNVRVGLEAEGNWAITFWAENAGDEDYNVEFSPGPAPGANFLFPGTPRRWGVDLVKWF